MDGPESDFGPGLAIGAIIAALVFTVVGAICIPRVPSCVVCHENIKVSKPYICPGCRQAIKEGKVEETKP